MCVDLDECENNPCVNPGEGQCVNVFGGYFCLGTITSVSPNTLSPMNGGDTVTVVVSFPEGTSLVEGLPMTVEQYYTLDW